MRRLGITVAVALLSLTLFAPFVSAAGATAGRRREAATSAPVSLNRLWHALRNVWAANGSSIDPFGKPGQAGTIPPPPAQTTSSDNGSIIDPLGAH